METLFSQFYVTGRDVAGHVTSSFQAKMARYMWTEEETELFLQMIKEKNITAILDSKQQRNAELYKELEGEMREKGFEKPWQILRSKWKTLKQRYLAERRIPGHPEVLNPQSWIPH